MASNEATITDEDGDYSDWIELYNYGTETVDLSAWGLSDNYNNPFKWTFPTNTYLEPGEFLLVWASGKDRTHSPFYVPVDIISDGSVWRYHDHGVDLGTEWREPDYDDSSWESGPAPLGYGPLDNYVVTEIDYGGDSRNKHITTYFRHEFTVEDTITEEPLELRLWLDDGAVIHLNGEEIARENLPSGPITYQTTTLTYVGRWPSWTSYAVPSAFLAPGRNVLAAQVHQHLPTSSDLAFDLSLSFMIHAISLHANFAISTDGEEILLTAPCGTRIDEVPATPIPRDISFGRTAENPHEWTYFYTPTPAAPNAGPSGHYLFETVHFSEPSRTYTSPLSVVLSGAGEGQEIRYTTDGSKPTAASTRYTEPFTLYNTTLLRARVVDDQGALGPSDTRHYVRMAPALEQKRSHLPLVVLDARGQSIQKIISVSGSIRQDGYFMLFDRDAEGISALNAIPDLATRQGIRLRGSSSLHAPKNPYSVEFWDENDRDRSLPILGMNPESDWVFYNGYNYDRAFIRNSVVYELSRRMGRWASDSRFVEVYVNHNGGTLTEDDYVGVYVIIERIKQGEGRLGPRNVNRSAIPPPGSIDVTEEGPWTGNYIFKIDRDRVDEYRLRPPLSTPGAWSGSMVLSRPKLYQLDGGPYPSRSAADAGSRQVPYIRAYIDAFEDALLSDRANGFTTRSYTNFIDRDAWVDHVLLNAFACNVDGLRLSAYYHKPENQRIAAGPIWDFDRSMGSYDSRDNHWNVWYDRNSGDTTRYFTYYWWEYLFEDPDFLQAFHDRWAELRKTIFTDDALYELITSMGEEIDMSSETVGSAAARDALRWPGSRPRNNLYIREIVHLRDWIVNRANWMDRRRPDESLLPRPPEIVINNETATIIDYSGGVVYYAFDDTDPRAPGGAPAGSLYNSPIALPQNTTRRLTARARDINGLWSTPTSVIIGHEAMTVPLHMWNFEDPLDYLQPSYSLGGGNITPTLGADTEILRNTAAQDFSSAHLRVNNPLYAHLTLSLPTEGYANIHLRYLTRRSGQGAGEQLIAYTTNGVTWTPHVTLDVDDAPPQDQIISFDGIEGVADNSNFAVRISFAQGTQGSTAGNNRFDDIVLSGTPLPGVNPPPIVANPVSYQSVVAQSDPLDIDLNDVFYDPNGDPLTFSFSADRPGVVEITLVDSIATITPVARGGCLVTLTADDGTNPPVDTSFYVLVYPEALVLADSAYTFSAWSQHAPEGTYPPHMLFLQSDRDDSEIDSELPFAYFLSEDDYHSEDSGRIGYPYSLTRRTRINGLNDNGISFINTGQGRDLGGALLALDTRNVTDVPLAFLAGTQEANLRMYAIRLQYRIGHTGPFIDLLDESMEPIEYVRNTLDGHEDIIGPVHLPQSLLDHAYVQLLWRYYHITGSLGARAELRLDDIVVANSSAQSATRLTFATHPPSAWQSAQSLPEIVVHAIDDNGFLDLTYEDDVTLSSSGDSIINGILVAQAVEGVARFTDITLTGTGTNHLHVHSGALSSATATRTDIADITARILPQYIQGEQDSEGNNTNRVPFAFRAEITGLHPYRTYRYGNRIALAEDSPLNDGAGNMIFAMHPASNWVRNTDSPRFQDRDAASRYHTFTTDAHGSYTGWFITEPTGNSRFTPGNTVYPHILLNNGYNGQDTHLTLTLNDPVTVIPFGTQPGEATGIMGPADGPEKSFIFLYDTVSETEGIRPLAGVQIEITGSEVDERYVPYYAEVVATRPAFWGTLIPNFHTSGIRRVELRSYHNASILASETFPEGIPATTDAHSGISPILLGVFDDIPLFLPGGDGEWNAAYNWTSYTYPDGSGSRAHINAPHMANRDVFLSAPVSIGAIFMRNAVSPYRNRITDINTANTFTFAVPTGNARLHVEGDGEGWSEFAVTAGVELTDDLHITVYDTGGNLEEGYGALRLRNTWDGPGGIIKDGPGMMSLTGEDKNYTGPTIISQGVLSVSAPATPAHSSAIVVAPGGQLRLSSGGELRSYTFGAPLSLRGMGRTGAPEAEQQGVLGALRYDPGENDNHAQILSPVVLDEMVDIHIDGTRNRLSLRGPLEGAHPLIQSGGGTLALEGDASSFSGAIIVSNGIFLASTDLRTSPYITVKPGAHLGGTGQLPDTTIHAEGALSPGDSIGALHAETLTLQEGSRYLWEFSLFTSDWVAADNLILPTVANSITVSVLSVDSVVAYPVTHTLFTFNGVMPALDALYFDMSDPPVIGLEYPEITYDENAIYVTILPEPSAALMLISIGVAYAIRRRCL